MFVFNERARNSISNATSLTKFLFVAWYTWYTCMINVLLIFFFCLWLDRKEEIFVYWLLIQYVVYIAVEVSGVTDTASDCSFFFFFS